LPTRMTSSANRRCAPGPRMCSMTALENTRSKLLSGKGTAVEDRIARLRIAALGAQDLAELASSRHDPLGVRVNVLQGVAEKDLGARSDVEHAILQPRRKKRKQQIKFLRP
jgi:hypothetical protein